MKSGNGRQERKEDGEMRGEETESLEKGGGGDMEEGLMGNEMMRESDEVKALEESSYDFNTMKDNPSNSVVFLIP